MDHKKKSIILLGNGKSLKKALITNILGRDLSTLSKRTILRRTQVYKDDVYKFTCTPDLDKDCEDIREVFSTIHRPDMSLLVVEDGFSNSDVCLQIKKLHKMTGKPEEDFTVVLPLRCKRTDLPFQYCSVEQLIRELHKLVVDEHQLITTKRSADHLMDTTGKACFSGCKSSVPAVTLVLLGMAGTGKSATGNTILGKERFYSTPSSMPVTKDIQVQSTQIGNTRVQVIDTPDLFDNEMKSYIRDKLVAGCRKLCESDPFVYLLVIHVSRFTDGERDILEKLEKAFGRGAREKTLILFTRGGDLEKANMSFQHFIHSCQPKLREIIEKCGNRCVLFENKNQNSQQVNELMKMVYRLLDDQRK